MVISACVYNDAKSVKCRQSQSSFLKYYQSCFLKVSVDHFCIIKILTFLQFSTSILSPSLCFLEPWCYIKNYCRTEDYEVNLDFFLIKDVKFVRKTKIGQIHVQM